MKTPRIRLDRLLVERGLAENIEQAQAMILSGAVIVADRPQDKAGTQVPADAPVRIRGEECPYVSRGGLKLRGALDAFNLAVEGMTAIDVGASTGGFTDCLLQAGAAKVYALDVAYGQLAWRLREDPRVVPIERMNVRHYDGAGITGPIDLAVIDASFISLKQVIPPVLKWIRDEAIVVALVKPQFEARKAEVGPHGVVRDPAIHERLLEEIDRFCRGLGLEVLGRCESPLTGPAGNREFFICLRKPSEKPRTEESP
ncbi:MAG: TlyA family RNA methyltransferase [Deltaproteobacteria bacterium]|nr:TlyA family RNA methyltransferase [Deltaproteobacteria bacterium]